MHKNLDKRLKLGAGDNDAKTTSDWSILATAGLMSSLFRGKISVMLPLKLTSSIISISTLSPTSGLIF